MDPVLFRVGDHAVRTYTVLMDAGLLAGLALAYFLWRRQKMTPAAFLDAVTYTMIGAVAGSRIGYVAAHWEYFSDHLSESFALWTGGMSFHGAFLGGCLALILYALIARKSFWQIADILATGLSLGAIFGWLACFTGGCAYGVVGNGFLFILLPDIYGIEAPRFALQLAGAMQSLIILIVLLLIVRTTRRPGVPFALFLLLYFGGQAGLELLRADESILVGSWRLGQIVDMALAAAGVLLFIFVRDRPEPAPDPNEAGADADTGLQNGEPIAETDTKDVEN